MKIEEMTIEDIEKLLDFCDEAPSDDILDYPEPFEYRKIIRSLIAQVRDYEEVLADHNRLVRELDIILNGEEGAAEQASLCDIISQVKEAEKTAEKAVEIAEANIRAEIADGGASCHWCIAKTRKQAFLEVANFVFKNNNRNTCVCDCPMRIYKALLRKAEQEIGNGGRVDDKQCVLDKVRQYKESFEPFFGWEDEGDGGGV